jgi:hypothetical protein
MSNFITFGRLGPDGVMTVTARVPQSMFTTCPFTILDLSHWRSDGTCLCNDSIHRRTAMKQWGYRKADFVKAGILKKGERL